MIRHLIPRFDWGRWGGAAITRDSANPREYDEVRGGCIVIQWLGLLIEIGVGRVSSPGRR